MVKMNSQLKAGDVVVLKSGGPLMTIGQVKEKEYWCIWFIKEELKAGYFPFDSIEQSDKRGMVPMKTIGAVD